MSPHRYSIYLCLRHAYSIYMHVGDIDLFVLFPNVCEWIFYYIRWLAFDNILIRVFWFPYFCSDKTPAISKKRPTADGFEAKMGSFWQKSAVHQPFLWLIPTSFFGWPTNSVSVEPSYNFSCIGGRFLQLKQSLNSPSNNPRSSPDHRLSVNIYNVGIIWNVDRRHRWTFLQIVWWTADCIRILLSWLNLYRLPVDKRRPGGRRQVSDFFVV